MILFHLFKEFIKIGLLSVGGGYATLPFLYFISEKYGWYTVNELNQIIAIGSITPGPVGINMATYAGLKTSGIIGSMVSTISIILPAYVIVILLSKFLDKYKDNIYVKSILTHIKPAGCALLFSVVVKLIYTTVKDYIGLAIITLLVIILLTKKQSPLFFVLFSGTIGLLLKFVLEIQ